ncbi:hypothetical protein [Candidatus Amarolinea dominans]|uniref:hypothetical protein n=1 Tax=Candidatus Amarolinea dominans TaxID=3140696 RepID=UPI0031358E93|nr:hypothetical protein [Anaerolineae bacterium]
MILLVVLFLNPAIPAANGVTFHRDEPPQPQPQSLVLAGQLTGDVVAVAAHVPVLTSAWDYAPWYWTSRTLATP